jgi:hypothetical protein
MADRAVAWRRVEPVLAAEFVALYVGAPLAMALAMPPDWLWPVFLGLTLVALGLLMRTPGFEWRALARGWAGIAWGEVAAVTAFSRASIRAGVPMCHDARHVPRCPRSLTTSFWLGRHRCSGLRRPRV